MYPAITEDAGYGRTVQEMRALKAIKDEVWIAVSHIGEYDDVPDAKEHLRRAIDTIQEGIDDRVEVCQDWEYREEAA